MKILYAIQGTGNGHLSRARDIIPILQKNHELDILVSGTQADVELPYPIKYRFYGLSFIFGEDGGVDFLKTYKKSNLKELFSEINSLPVDDYDLIINDFEPVSAWACDIKNIKCVALSHQSAVLNKNAPQPSDVDILGRAILMNYAPATVHYGFHFKAFGENIYTPVIRRQIRQIPLSDKGHYTVYLPAYDDKRIIKVLEQCEDVRWQVFSKHNKKIYCENNILIQPINNVAFIESMASSTGVLCGAGFETPAEALYMKKKLMVIPMKGQYEQQCNAAALKEMGVPVIKSLKVEKLDKIREWISDDTIIEVDYPDLTEEIINRIIAEDTIDTEAEKHKKNKKAGTLKKFRNKVIKKITSQL